MGGGVVISAHKIGNPLSSFFGTQIESRPNLTNGSLLSIPKLSCSYAVFLRLNRPPRSTCIVACLPLTSSSTPKTTSVVSTKLFVSGLSFRTTKESLTNAFQRFGELVEVNLVMDRIANRPRGFAFLRYSTDEESKNAIKGMHGKFLDGRVIFVEVAKSKAEIRKELTERPLIQH